MVGGMKPFEIFRSGRHTSMQGAALTYSESDLGAIAAGYDVERHHAPIVVGHPKTDAPAYGWVDALEVRDGRLVATPGSVDPAFAELVAAKRFKTVSASFYPPTSPANPTPGIWYLKHVGFLGAVPPAVKGLKPVEFAADDQAITIEFADWSTVHLGSSTARLFRSIRDWLIGRDGIEVAEQVLPDWELQMITQAAADATAEARSETVPAYADPITQEVPVTPLPDAAELQRRADELAARETAFAEQQAATRAGEDAAFVVAIVEAGRFPAGLKDQAIALFAALDADGEVSFAEGEQTVKQTQREVLRGILSALPKPVVTDELAGGEAQGVDFADPVAVGVAITTEIETARSRGEEISAADALGRLQQRTGK